MHCKFHMKKNLVGVKKKIVLNKYLTAQKYVLPNSKMNIFYLGK